MVNDPTLAPFDAGSLSPGAQLSSSLADIHSGTIGGEKVFVKIWPKPHESDLRRVVEQATWRPGFKGTTPNIGMLQSQAYEARVYDILTNWVLDTGMCNGFPRVIAHRETVKLGAALDMVEAGLPADADADRRLGARAAVTYNVAKAFAQGPALVRLNARDAKSTTSAIAREIRAKTPNLICVLAAIDGSLDSKSLEANQSLRTLSAYLSTPETGDFAPLGPARAPAEEEEVSSLMLEAAPGISFRRFLQDNAEIDSFTLATILYKCAVNAQAMALIGVAHNDLHTENVLVETRPDDPVETYLVGSQAHCVSGRYRVKFIDYDRSYSEWIGNNPAVDPEDDFDESNQIYNAVVPGADMLKLASFVCKMRPNDAKMRAFLSVLFARSSSTFGEMKALLARSSRDPSVYAMRCPKTFGPLRPSTIERIAAPPSTLMRRLAALAAVPPPSSAEALRGSVVGVLAKTLVVATVSGTKNRIAARVKSACLSEVVSREQLMDEYTNEFMCKACSSVKDVLHTARRPESAETEPPAKRPAL